MRDREQAGIVLGETITGDTIDDCNGFGRTWTDFLGHCVSAFIRDVLWRISFTTPRRRYRIMELRCTLAAS